MRGAYCDAINYKISAVEAVVNIAILIGEHVCKKYPLGQLVIVQ